MENERGREVLADGDSARELCISSSDPECNSEDAQPRSCVFYGGFWGKITELEQGQGEKSLIGKKSAPASHERPDSDRAGCKKKQDLKFCLLRL